MDMHKNCSWPGCEKRPEIGYSFQIAPQPYRYDHCGFVHMNWNLDRLNRTGVPRSSFFKLDGGVDGS